MRVSGYRSRGLNTTFLKTVGSWANAPASPERLFQSKIQNPKAVGPRAAERRKRWKPATTEVARERPPREGMPTKRSKIT